MQQNSTKSVQWLSHESISDFYLYLNSDIEVGPELKLHLKKKFT